MQCQSFYHISCIQKNNNHILFKKDTYEINEYVEPNLFFINKEKNNILQNGDIFDKREDEKEEENNNNKSNLSQDKNGNKKGKGEKKGIYNNNYYNINNRDKPKYMSKVVDYNCDICKIKNLIKIFIIRESQINNSFLNLMFKKKKEKK